MKSKYSLAILTALSLLPFSSVNGARVKKQDYVIKVIDYQSDPNKADRSREGLREKLSPDFEFKEDRLYDSKNNISFGTALYISTTTPKKMLKEMVDTQSHTLSKVYSKRDMKIFESISGQFIGALDARVQGDLPRFCSYLSVDIRSPTYEEKTKNFCEKIRKEDMIRCKNAGLNINDILNTKAITFYSAEEIREALRSADKIKDPYTGKEYAVSVETNRVCTGEKIGAVFTRENGKWKIVLWKE